MLTVSGDELFRHDDRAFNAVFQLTHVTGPTMRLDRANGVRRQPTGGLAKPGRHLLQQKLPFTALISFNSLLWLAVLSTKTTDPVALGGAIVNVGVVLDEQITSDEEIASGVPGATVDTGPEMIWQATTATVQPMKQSGIQWWRR